MRHLTRREARAAEAAQANPAAAGPAIAQPAATQPVAAQPAATQPVRPHAVTTPAVHRSPARPAAAAAAAANAPSRDRRPISRRALGLATFSVVGGLFATAAIPAYGARSTTAASGGSATVGRTQNLTVSPEAQGATAVRDAFAAPTQDQLDAASRQASVLSTASDGSYTTVKTQAIGDDYPWPGQLTDNEGGGLSPLMYYYRECVDFVAWRFNRDAGATAAPWIYTWSIITPMGGSAYEWPDNWAAKGWATSATPIVGCAAWFTYNHVAYVQAVNADGSVLIEEYNYGGKHSYGTRTLAAGAVPLFLYPPGT
ncbi:CHAP domain-containing protein [Microbacteriaceae bacterium VKM Ac-2855]|nr:CHAP domain-containing protein [Microbacteriaceae bacterium VKM Ac-2855]